MAKSQNDIILDQALSYVINNATQLAVCSAQPATYNEAVTTYKLALKTGLTSGSFTGPADATPNGRKITVNQQAGVTVDATNTATHVALCSGSVLLLVTTCTSQLLTMGNTVTIPAYVFTLPDVV
jgi:hypothetical protein